MHYMCNTIAEKRELAFRFLTYCQRIFKKTNHLTEIETFSINLERNLGYSLGWDIICNF